MRINLKAVVGVAVSILLLWWALRDVSFAEVVREIRGADPWLFLAAVVAATLTFPIRAARWKVLLLPVSPNVAFRPRFAATAIGTAANNLIPARVGEFARAYTLSRLTPIPVSAALASMVIERLLDGLVLVGFLFAAMAAPSFPSGAPDGIDPRSAAGFIALVMGMGGVVLFALVLAPTRSVALIERIAQRVLPQSWARPLLDSLHAFLGGLGVLRDPRLFAISVGWALGQWIFVAWSYLLAFRAFGIEVGFVGAVFIQSLISLAVALPSSPGFFGPWEAAAKLGLALWGVPAGKAVSFAIGFHIGGFIPITAMGIWYVWRLNLRWREVEDSEEVVESAIEETAPLRN